MSNLANLFEFISGDKLTRCCCLCDWGVDYKSCWSLELFIAYFIAIAVYFTSN